MSGGASPGFPRWGWGLVRDYGSLAALLLLVAISAARNEYFLDAENLANIVLNSSFVGIIAIGMTLVIIMGGIDLSVGSMVAFIGGITILALNAAGGAAGDAAGDALAIAAAVAVALGAGLVLGAINGIVIAIGRVAPFVATLGAFAAWRSAALAIADGGEYRASVGLFKGLSNTGIRAPFLRNAWDEPIIIHWPILVFISIAIIAHIILTSTRFGRYIYAVGSNERAARYSAIRVSRVKIAGYALLGLTCGLAALLRASQMGAISSSSTGQMYELDAIAAVVIGGTSMRGGRGRVLGTVAGVLILAIVSNMLNLEQVSAYWQGMVKGVIIVGAVLIQRADERG